MPRCGRYTQTCKKTATVRKCTHVCLRESCTEIPGDTSARACVRLRTTVVVRVGPCGRVCACLFVHPTM
jgi:hypothetical protein